MGKCLRSCKQQRSPAVEAAAYLTLRSGRRVPPAASPRRRHRRGGGRRCGNGAAAASASAARQRRRRVLRSRGGPEEEEEELPSSQEDSGVCNQSRSDLLNLLFNFKNAYVFPHKKKGELCIRVRVKQLFHNCSFYATIDKINESCLTLNTSCA